MEECDAPALLEELRDELDVEDRELPDVVLQLCFLWGETGERKMS